MPNRKVRIPVGSLTDVEPIHRQLDPYYLERERMGWRYAPMELVPERELMPEGRPGIDIEEQRRLWQETVGQDYAALMQRSLTGSKTFTRAEVAQGYRRITA